MRIINANVISDGSVHPDMCVVINGTTIGDIVPMSQLRER